MIGKEKENTIEFEVINGKAVATAKVIKTDSKKVKKEVIKKDNSKNTNEMEG